MKILGIESSFDETGAAIVEDGKTILTNIVASSAEMHQKYGGVVPEVAARKQVEAIIPVLTEAMTGHTKNDIDTIAVTVGPGLIGSLLVGVETAKTLSFVWNKPLIPVNHVLAHIYASFLENNSPQFPAIALVVSGAHTELYIMTDEKTLKWLGGTLDDAAGECFDKTARLLGLPYPGGPAIATEAAKNSNAKSQIKLPRPMLDDSHNFSFSGLKTAVIREWKKNKPNEKYVSAFAYEIQEAITDVLVTKTLAAAKKYRVKSIIVTGGVASNQRLKEKFHPELQIMNPGLSLHVPSPKLCVDSASFIAAYAYYHNQPAEWRKIEATPSLTVEV